MSKNTEQYQLITPSSSSTKRLQTSTDFNTPSSPQSYTVRYRYNKRNRERERKEKKIFKCATVFILVYFTPHLKRNNCIVKNK